jgi:hypothetical protein
MPARDQSLPDIPLPSGWAKNVKPAVLHIISLAHYAITCARGWQSTASTPEYGLPVIQLRRVA